jgi:putative protein-disulfide isomerase
MKFSFTLLITIAMIASSAAQTAATTRLLYFFDPLCGWCYGFSPIIRDIAANEDTISVEIVCGGMITGEREGPIGKEFADYILGAIPRVQAMTGVTFGDAYKERIRDGSYYNSSLKPSIAMMVAKELMPDKAVFFAADMQKAFYAEGKDVNSDAFYTDMAKGYGLDPQGFLSKMNDPAYKAKAEAEFERTSQFGVSGFPCVVTEWNGQYYMVSSGFATKADLMETLQRIRQ